MRTLLIFHMFLESHPFPVDDFPYILEGDLTPERIREARMAGAKELKSSYGTFASIVLAQAQVLPDE